MHVFGPYPSGNRWRLLLRENGQQQAMPFDTKEEAENTKLKMLSGLDDFQCKTIGEAMQEYLTYKQELGNKPRSIKTCAEKLKFLPESDSLISIDQKRAEKLYREQTEKVSVATHQKNLRDARSFFEYCIRQRYISTNPWKQVRPIGKAKAGKPQLRRDEAKKLSAVLLEHAKKGDHSALALTVQVLFGLRSAEVLGLRKRDLDADGTVLVVEGTKTKNARRSLSIESPIVRELLAKRTEALGPEALIFGRDDREAPLPTDHLFKKLHRFCREAGVPEICPHSLRGLHSSLAIEGGQTSAVVAAALGHGSDAVTLKHYIAPSAVEKARAARVAAAILEPELERLISSLRALSPTQLDHVLSALGRR